MNDCTEGQGPVSGSIAALEDAGAFPAGVRPALGRYLSPPMVERALTTPGVAELMFGGEHARFDAVIMFADVRGFTRLAEFLDPRDVAAVLNEFFTMLAAVARRHDGTLFHMAGDSLMVGFGVPFAQPDAAQRAFDAAREMLERFRPLADAWAMRHRVAVGLGIGINRGEVVAGNIGAPGCASFTIVGDPVNTASRLTERARAGEFLVAEGVFVEPLTPTSIGAFPLPPLRLKGRLQPLTAYAVTVIPRD